MCFSAVGYRRSMSGIKVKMFCFLSNWELPICSLWLATTSRSKGILFLFPSPHSHTHTHTCRVMSLLARWDSSSSFWSRTGFYHFILFSGICYLLFYKAMNIFSVKTNLVVSIKSYILGRLPFHFLTTTLFSACYWFHLKENTPGIIDKIPWIWL